MLGQHLQRIKPNSVNCVSVRTADYGNSIVISIRFRYGLEIMRWSESIELLSAEYLRVFTWASPMRSKLEEVFCDAINALAPKAYANYLPKQEHITVHKAKNFTPEDLLIIDALAGNVNNA